MLLEIRQFNGNGIIVKRTSNDDIGIGLYRAPLRQVGP